MTGGPPWSAAAARERERRGLLGQLGREATRASWAAAACWAGKGRWAGLERGKGRGFWEFRDLEKGFKQIEFKFEFEFQQPKIMHQHECHN
jgi:hypothetical protein